MKTLLISAAVLLSACAINGQSAADFGGHWIGRLNANSFPVDIVMHVENIAQGNYQSVIDIPGQFEDYVADTTFLSGDTLIFKWFMSQTTFKGTLGNRSEMNGTWSTRGNVTPITFHRSEDGIYRRPQEPTGQVPYVVREVSFKSAKDPSVVLAGTLTLPRGVDAYPAVVLLSGSGAQDRDEAVHGHRPFLVLADRLTRAGIAVLRFDDRGTAGSTGTYATANTEDFAQDAIGAVDFLEDQDLPITRVGLLGHTEGGSAGMIAASRSDVGFLILLASVGIPHDDYLISQSVAALKNSGSNETMIRVDTLYTRKLYRNMRTWQPENPDTAAVKAITDEFYNRSGLIRTRYTSPGSFYEGQLRLMKSPWFHFYATFIPGDYLKKVKCPVLAINGSEDIQVVADINLSAIERILNASSRNRNHKVEKLNGLNHYFQPAEGDLAHEYGLIMTTFDEEAMKGISDWILSLNL